MLKSYRLLTIAIAALLVAGIASTASAQNMLANPGFEEGYVAWTPFNNCYIETTGGDPCINPYEGAWDLKFFGNFWGGFNVSGAFQNFPAVAGDEWTMSCKSYVCPTDPMLGDGPPNSCWAIQKIVWFNAENGEIGGVESTIATGLSPTGVWMDNAPIVGVAPEGTAYVQILLLYLQPDGNYDGGAVQVDNVVAYQSNGPVGVEESTWGGIKTQAGK